jgi:hypothetical protein
VCVCVNISLLSSFTLKIHPFYYCKFLQPSSNPCLMFNLGRNNMYMSPFTNIRCYTTVSFVKEQGSSCRSSYLNVAYLHLIFHVMKQACPPKSGTLLPAPDYCRCILYWELLVYLLALFIATGWTVTKWSNFEACQLWNLHRQLNMFDWMNISISSNPNETQFIDCILTWPSKREA